MEQMEVLKLIASLMIYLFILFLDIYLWLYCLGYIIWRKKYKWL